MPSSGNVIVITFYVPSCLGQETAKRPFSLRVKLPPVYHTWWRLHSVPFITERQAESYDCEYEFLKIFGLTRPGIEPGSTVSVADNLFTRYIFQRCLVYNPAKRISAKVALCHPYFDDLDKKALPGTHVPLVPRISA